MKNQVLSDVTSANFYQTTRRHILENHNFILMLFSNLLLVCQTDLSNRFTYQKLSPISHTTLNTSQTDFTVLRHYVGYILMQHSIFITSSHSAPIIFLGIVLFSIFILLVYERNRLKSRTINVLQFKSKSSALRTADRMIKYIKI
jgi:hypothetical protein